MPVTEAEFRTAVLPFTLNAEGGFVADRKDPGCWTGGKIGRGVLKGTKFGISAGAHPTLDIRHLTIDEAAAIYWTEYCVRPGFDRLSLPMLMVAFDGGVNCGPARARAWLSIAATSGSEAQQIFVFSARNLAFHRTLKGWRRYGAGWTTRIDGCKAQAMALLTAAPAVVPSRIQLPQADAARPTPRAADQPRAGTLTLLVRGIAALFTPTPQPQGP